MDDPTILKVALGAITALGGTLLARTHGIAKDSHKKIDKERDDNEARLALVYQRIADSSEKTEQCRTEIYELVRKLAEGLMTETQVKDFVDREMRAMQAAMKVTQESISAVHSDIKELLKHER